MSGTTVMRWDGLSTATFRPISAETRLRIEAYRGVLMDGSQMRASLHHMRSIMDADGRPLLRSPEDVVAEKTVWAGIAATLPFMNLPADSEQLAQNQMAVSTSLLRAAGYLWMPDVWNQIEVMRADVPRHTIGEFRLGSDSAYWTLADQSRIYYMDVEGQRRKLRVGRYVLEESPEGLVYYGLATVEDQSQLLLIGGVIRPGTVYPDDYEPQAGGSGREMMATLLSALAFMESPYIPKSARRLDRASRRRLSIRSAVDEQVTFVDLRPAANRTPSDSDFEPGVGPGRDYSCRWVVRGHWREQWYPSLGCHKLRYIPPYIKGPEDKPLKQTVYRVVR